MNRLIEPKMKKLNIVKDERSLNDFPDGILGHIVSFLPTKFVVGLSVLSKRWEYMWTSLPNLDFIEEEIHENEKLYSARGNFVEFVRRVLVDNPAQIKKFILSCEMGGDYLVKGSISAAVRRNAKEIHLYLHKRYWQSKLSDFPNCLFSSEALVVLKIHSRRFGHHVNLLLPPQFFLPRLKILALIHSTLTGYHSTNLLFASPALEELVIDHCIWEEVQGEENELIISAPKLQSLSIEADYIDFITIEAPLLKTFNYKGEILAFRLSCSSSIVKAAIHFHNTLFEEKLQLAHDLLRSLESVKYLELSTSVIQALSNEANAAQHSIDLPIFRCLAVLKVVVEREFTNCDLEMILRNCPCLETLIFPKGFFPWNRNSDPTLSSESTYSLSTLKNIKIMEFMGSVAELYAVHVLLAKATFLDTMKLYISNPHEREQIGALLSLFPNGTKIKILDEDGYSCIN